jgi:hypothetical protein
MWMMVVLLTRGVPKVGHNFGVAIGYFLPGVMAYVCFGRWRPRLPVGLLPVFLGALWVAFLLHANFHRGWIACLLLGLGLPMFRQMSAEWAIVPSRIIAKFLWCISHSSIRDCCWHLLAAGAQPRSAAFGGGRAAGGTSGSGVSLARASDDQVGGRLAARAEKRYEQHELENFREAHQVNR